MDVFGVKLLGLTAENGRKLLLTLVIIAVALLLSRILQAIAGFVFRKRQDVRVRFWTQQTVRLTTVVVLVLGTVSVWFDNPGRLTPIVGLLSAGLAVALQRRSKSPRSPRRTSTSCAGATSSSRRASSPGSTCA